MTFKEYVATLGRELGVEIEAEGEACAFSLGSAEGDSVEILMQGDDVRGVLLTSADLGEPPPEGRERLFQTLLEANDFFGDTAGATLSLSPRSGSVRLQRCDDMDALAGIGAAKALVAFADTAAAWKLLVADFRAAPPAAPDGMDAASGAMLV